MKSQSLIYFIILFFVTCLNTYAQGIFVEKNEFGLYINSGYSGVQNGHAISYGGGIVSGGMLEFNFTHTNSTLKNPYYYYSTKDIEVGSNSIALGIVLVNKEAQVQAFFGYSSSDQKFGDFLLIGSEVGGKISLHPDLFWYPTLSFALSFPEEFFAEKPMTTIGISAPLLVAKHFYIGPSFALSEGETSWGVSAGILLTFEVKANNKIK